MKIVVDAMGGDKAPEEIIKGVVMAYRLYDDVDLILAGKNDIIIRELRKYKLNEDDITISPASEIISMEEKPALALRKKKDSSIVVGCKLVKEDKADAFISAGNTGAVMASGLFNIGRIKGIKRPPISTVFPSQNGETLVLDAGANMDANPYNLLQYAIMGQIQAQNVLQVNNPRMGLLSVGEEKEKGNKLINDTYELLEKDRRINNFIGNVEGRDIFAGSCDVVICDGFVGNVVLKTTEGVASFMFDMLKDALIKNMRAKLGALLVKPYLQEIKERVDYRQYGGAPLLGIDGVVIISHGSSDAQAILNAIRVAVDTIKTGVVDKIKTEIEGDGEEIES